MSGDKFPMITGVLTPFYLIWSHYIISIHSSITPFNLSHFLYPKVTSFTESDTPLPQPPPFLQGVLDAIANKERWAVEDIRVSEVDMKKAKYRTGLRYELRVRFGKAEIVLKMHEELSEWKKMMDQMNGTLNFESLATIIATEAVIDSFKIEGPFELRVTSDNDQLSLLLPLNMTHSGLKQISVGEGILVEVQGAREISMFHHPTISTNRNWNYVGTILPGLCTAPTPIRILGPAFVLAHRNQRPTTLVQTAFTSKNAIKLFPDKCYGMPNHKKPSSLHNSLSSRIGSLERVLRSFLNNSSSKSYNALGSVKTRVKPLSVFRFRLELEREIRDDDAFWSTSAKWRTRPTVERVYFEVLARIEDEVLRPLAIKKVRPMIDTDTFAWSSLSSNISFTQFPSVLLHPEALTLDVKW
ncbi:signal peptidase I [Striga asiatica]|uniref:Signal peptidase I n=1 Tax=Striga asiatica TaxID=4170 RepID=A0A5A7QZP2_STRAF|nr:signal peptidase I [Striga asiatica]